MKPIKVKIWGEFKKDWDDKYPRRTKVFIDRIRGFGGCGSFLYMRVANLWKQPKWFDSGWFKFK